MAFCTHQSRSRRALLPTAPRYKKDRKVAEKFAGLKVGPFSKENMEKWANEKARGTCIALGGT